MFKGWKVQDELFLHFFCPPHPPKKKNSTCFTAPIEPHFLSTDFSLFPEIES